MFETSLAAAWTEASEVMSIYLNGDYGAPQVGSEKCSDGFFTLRGWATADQYVVGK